MQQLLAVVLVVLLAGAAVAALVAGGTGRGDGYASPLDAHTWRLAASAIGVVFFAFTG